LIGQSFQPVKLRDRVSRGHAVGVQRSDLIAQRLERPGLLVRAVISGLFGLLHGRE